MLFLYAIICGVVVAGLSAGLNWLELRRWRRAAQDHWSERARWLYPARMGASFQIIFFPLSVMLIGISLFQGGTLENILVALLVWLCCVLATYPMAHEITPEQSFKPWFKEVIGSWTLLAGWIGIYAVAGFLMPREFGPLLWISFLFFVGILIALNTRGLLPLLRMMGIIRRAPRDLYELVERVAKPMAAPVNAVWVWPTSTANAFALPATSELVFTTRLLDRMSQEEVEAICAHELGHLKESRTVLWLRILGSLSAAHLVLMKPAVNHFGPLAILALLILWIILQRLTNWMSRKLELKADAVAVNETDGVTYAMALAHLHELNQFPAVMPKKNLTHPDLYDRLLAAGITPDFPRPKKPAENSAGGWLAVFTFAFSLISLLIPKWG